MYLGSVAPVFSARSSVQPAKLKAKVKPVSTAAMLLCFKGYHVTPFLQYEWSKSYQTETMMCLLKDQPLLSW